MLLYEINSVSYDKLKEMNLIDNNNSLLNIREVTEEEISRSMLGMYTPEYIGYISNIEHKDYKHYINMHVYIFWDRTGIGMYADYRNRKLRWFKFGCKHDYKELTPSESNAKGIQHFGTFWHVKECRICGFISSYDSSG